MKFKKRNIFRWKMRLITYYRFSPVFHLSFFVLYKWILVKFLLFFFTLNWYLKNQFLCQRAYDKLYFQHISSSTSLTKNSFFFSSPMTAICTHNDLVSFSPSVFVLLFLIKTLESVATSNIRWCLRYRFLSVTNGLK